LLAFSSHFLVLAASDGASGMYLSVDIWAKEGFFEVREKERWIVIT
jgi:hypothetical protein